MCYMMALARRTFHHLTHFSSIANNIFSVHIHPQVIFCVFHDVYIQTHNLVNEYIPSVLIPGRASSLVTILPRFNYISSTMSELHDSFYMELGKLLILRQFRASCSVPRKCHLERFLGDGRRQHFIKSGTSG